MKKAIIYFGLSVLLLFNNAEAQTLPAYLPADGLVAWYPFNGNANDESGNGNDGTVNGATLTADRNSFGNCILDWRLLSPAEDNNIGRLSE
jgi:hypothetical protein